MPKEYIDREAAFRAILGQPPDAHYPGWYADSIKEIPAADVAPVVHGEWVVNPKREYDYICSVCGGDAHEDRWRNNAILTPYCPNCGAKMDGGGHGNKIAEAL
jgi:hypothetical protein